LNDIAKASSALTSQFDGRIVIAGAINPDRRAELLALAGPAANRLQVLGSVASRADLFELYRSAAVYVSASELEAYPLTLHEAASQGCPMVLTDIPPHREIAGSRAVYYRVGDL